MKTRKIYKDILNGLIFGLVFGIVLALWQKQFGPIDFSTTWWIAIPLGFTFGIAKGVIKSWISDYSLA